MPVPRLNFSVMNETFNTTPYKSVDVEKTPAYSAYGNILISDNTFNPTQPLGGGTFIYGLDFQAPNLSDAQLAQFTVTSNTINLVTGEDNQYGIFFDQS